MTDYLVALLSCIIGYICGNLLSGYFIGKRHDVDLRKEGSGNVGSTNTLRVLGVKAAVITLILDISKAIVAVGLVYALFHNRVNTVSLQAGMLFAGFFAILGHDFPFYMNFKGGKGVATTGGMIIILFPQTLPVLVPALILIVWITKYVSLASCTCAVLFFIQVLIFGHLGWLHFEPQVMPVVYIISFAASLIILIKHRSNIKRLLSGTENKISFHSKKS